MSQPGPKTGVPIASIKTPYHAKPNPDDVAALAASIRELGLLCPPTVDHADGKGYVLVAGRRRLAACYSLGWERIPVHIREQSKAYQDPGVAGQRYRAEHAELLRELATLDENLVREHLTAAQRAEATAKRKKVWEALHPEATAEAKKADGARKTNAKLGRGDAPAKSAKASSAAFTKETADRTGRSERSVRLDAQIGSALAESPEAAAIVEAAPKPITQAALLAVAQAPKEDRPAVAAAAVAKAKKPRQYGPGKGRKPSKATSTTVAATDEEAPAAAEPEVVGDTVGRRELVNTLRTMKANERASLFAEAGCEPSGDGSRLDTILAILRGADVVDRCELLRDVLMGVDSFDRDSVITSVIDRDAKTKPNGSLVYATAAIGHLSEDDVREAAAFALDRMDSEERRRLFGDYPDDDEDENVTDDAEQPTPSAPRPTTDADGKRLWMIAVQQTSNGCTAQVMHQPSPICCAGSTPKEAIVRVADTFWMLKGATP